MSIYSELMKLCNNEAFFFTDQVYKGATYRIFNYRLTSYSDFCLPSALECRGVMYQITDRDGNQIDPILVCRPMRKFFNLGENPFTMNLDLSRSNIERIEMKGDGSLISTFMDVDGSLGIKSKGSLFSEQAQAAMRVIEDNSGLKCDLEALTRSGWTVNLEFVAPYNRIVLSYPEAALIVLNVRNNETGQYMDHRDLCTYTSIRNHLVQEASQLYDQPYDQLIVDAKQLTNIEGFVVHLCDGTTFKLKTEWYLIRHRGRDHVTSEKGMFELALHESLDDMKALFCDDQLLLAQMDAMEKHVSTVYNHLVAKIENFYRDNKHLDRKSYAILGQQQLAQHEFGQAMMLFCDKKPDYKAVVMKYFDFYKPNPPIVSAPNNTTTE